MIKLTYKELVLSTQSKNTTGPAPFIKLVCDRSLGIKTRVAIAQLWEQMQRHLEVYENARIEINEKYGEKQEDGSIEIIGKEAEEAAQAEFDELLAIEVELLGDRISTDDLESRKIDAEQDIRLRLDCNELLIVKWLFREFGATTEESNKPKPLVDPNNEKAMKRLRGGKKAGGSLADSVRQRFPKIA